MTLAIVQARMGSTRFPEKVLRPIGGVPLIELLLRRLSAAARVDRTVVATSADPRNAPLAACVRALGYDVFEGSEEDVLDRYYRAACPYRPDVVVRITGDCPLVDPDVVDRVVEAGGNDALTRAAVLAEATARASRWNVCVNAPLLDPVRAADTLRRADEMLGLAAGMLGEVERACAPR